MLGHPGGEVARVQGASEGPLPLHSREGCGTLGQEGASEGGVGHTGGEGASEGPLPLHKRNVLSFPFFSSLNVETICTSTFITEKVYKKFN